VVRGERRRNLPAPCILLLWETTREFECVIPHNATTHQPTHLPGSSYQRTGIKIYSVGESAAVCLAVSIS